MKPWYWIYALGVIALTTMINVAPSGASSSGRWGSSWGSSSSGGGSHK
jgi:hypothetical protein